MDDSTPTLGRKDLRERINDTIEIAGWLTILAVISYSYNFVIFSIDLKLFALPIVTHLGIKYGRRVTAGIIIALLPLLIPFTLSGSWGSFNSNQALYIGSILAFLTSSRKNDINTKNIYPNIKAYIILLPILPISISTQRAIILQENSYSLAVFPVINLYNAFFILIALLAINEVRRLTVYLIALSTILFGASLRIMFYVFGVEHHSIIVEGLSFTPVHVSYDIFSLGDLIGTVIIFECTRYIRRATIVSTGNEEHRLLPGQWVSILVILVVGLVSSGGMEELSSESSLLIFSYEEIWPATVVSAFLAGFLLRFWGSCLVSVCFIIGSYDPGSFINTLEIEKLVWPFFVGYFGQVWRYTARGGAVVSIHPGWVRYILITTMIVLYLVSRVDPNYQTVKLFITMYLILILATYVVFGEGGILERSVTHYKIYGAGVSSALFYALLSASFLQVFLASSGLYYDENIKSLFEVVQPGLLNEIIASPLEGIALLSMVIWLFMNTIANGLGVSIQARRTFVMFRRRREVCTTEFSFQMIKKFGYSKDADFPLIEVATVRAIGMSLLLLPVAVLLGGLGFLFLLHLAP